MNEFKRKQWTRIGLSILAVAIAALFLTGIAGGKDMTYRLVDLKSETEQGFGGEVTVNAGLKGNTVRSLTIDTPNETEGLGKKASGEEFTGQFIGREGPFAYGENGIEAISGATITSDAVLKALNRAITGETEPAEAEEPKAEEPAAEEQPAEEAPAEEQPAEEQPAEEQPAEETPAETQPAGEASAAAEASEQGFGGNVTVHLELNEDNTVKSLKIDTPDETAGLGQRASEAEFTDQFIGKTGPFAYGRDGIEALSGATITSEAALKAINSFFGGEPAAEEQPAEEKPAEAQPAEETSAEETPAEPQPAGEASAAAEASEQGFGGNVTVHLELNEDNTVKSLKIDTPDETAGLGQRASEAEFTDQFIGKAGPFAYGRDGIEALSGATITSEAALKAINSFFGGESAAEEQPAEEKPAEEQPAGGTTGEEKPAEEQPAETPAEEPAAEQPAEKPAEKAGVYSYLAERETVFSTIRVIVSTRNGVITNCIIRCDAKEGQTDLVKDEDETAWASAVVETQGAELDTVSGATISSDAVREAAAEILEKIR